VVLDGEVRKRINQFYGGKDGPVIFNKGFVEHNEQEGYQQSKMILVVLLNIWQMMETTRNS